MHERSGRSCDEFEQTESEKGRLLQRLAARQHVLIDAIYQRSIEIKNKRRFGGRDLFKLRQPQRRER